MRVLITGGAGFIGSHIVDRCVAGGHRVAVVDDLSTGRAERVNPEAKLHVVDIRSAGLDAVLDTERPEAVIHLAAQAEVRRSVEDPRHDLSVNVGGTLNLLESCRRVGVGRVIYASSGGAAYGDTDVVPTPERHAAHPASPYGISKLTAEHYVRCWDALYGIRGLALRYANVYGPRQSPAGEAGVVAIFAARLLKGEPVLVNGDGLQTRDYVYVGDVVEANVLALERPEVTGVINVGTGVETTVLDLWAGLERAAEARGERRHGPAKLGEQRRSALDVTLAYRRLGWRPRVRLDAGLRRTVEHVRAEMV